MRAKVMENCRVYRVNHRALFRRVFCFLSLSLAALLVAGIVFKIIWGGLVQGRDLTAMLRSLRKLLVPPAVIALPGVYAVVVLCIKLISMAMVSFEVTLSNTEISGRSGTGRKRTLPLGDLKEFRCFDSNGFHGGLLISRSHGDILIPGDLYDGEQLFASLEPYLSAGPHDPYPDSSPHGDL
ncbi:MAG: hypothetical protein ABFD90_16595 [Phycisphaerales bacterium]